MNSRIVWFVIAGVSLGKAGTIGSSWIGGSNLWGNAASWSNGVPNNDQFNNYLASINSGGTDMVTLTGLSPTVTSLNLGGSVGTSNLQVTGSTLGVVNGLTIGSGTMGIVSGGVVNTGGFAEVGSGSTGAVIVSGAGSQWNNSGSFVAVGATGTPGTGTLNLSAGATGSNALQLAIGNWGLSTGTFMLTDPGTQWTSTGQMIVGGFSSSVLGAGVDPGTGTVTITNGAQLFTAKGSSPTGSSGIIGLVVGTGTVTVSNGGTWNQDGALHVAASTSGTAVGAAYGTLNILSGGVVNDVSGAINFNDKSHGTVLISGTGSIWNNTGTLDVGTDQGNGTGVLTIDSSGLVKASNLVIHANGTVNLFGGTIQGVVTDDGVLNVPQIPSSGRTLPSAALANAAQTVTMNGDFNEASNGALIFQAAGPQSYSQLAITGQGTFSGLIDFDFIDGFAPSAGQTFNFISDSAADFSQATFEVSGLAPGFRFSTQYANGVFSMTANNQGFPATPEPGSILLTGFGLLWALWSRRSRRSS